jgi:hypothetical protein
VPSLVVIVPMGGAVLVVAVANKLPGGTTIAALPYGIFTASANFTYQPEGIQEPCERPAFLPLVMKKQTARTLCAASLPATCNLHVPVGGVSESPLAAMHRADALAILGTRRGVRACEGGGRT